MSNFVKVIKSCEQANGAGTKKIIQGALTTLDKTGWRLFWEAMNPYRVFGVRKFDMPKHHAKCMDEQQDFEPFFTVLNKLDAKELTGDAARSAITDALSDFNLHTQEYLVRILDKDLRAGFSADTVNKVLKDVHGIIPSFEVMLAEKMVDEQEFSDYITFPCQADFKYDGCLSASWVIHLKDGRAVTIGEFVDQDLEGEVLSYNITSKKNEWKKIQAKIKNSMPERTYEWFQLTLEDGTVLPPLTGNHRVWLPVLKCWRRVDELKVDNVLYSL